MKCIYYYGKNKHFYLKVNTWENQKSNKNTSEWPEVTLTRKFTKPGRTGPWSGRSTYRVGVDDENLKNDGNSTQDLLEPENTRID